MASDRFTSIRPTFAPPTNESALEAITPRPRDHTPSPSVVQRVEESGHADLAALLEQAQQAARQHATLASEHARERLPRHERLRSREKETPSYPQKESIVSLTSTFQPSDILDDREFIRRTRDGNLHTPEMRALFWANGGEKYLALGLSYAQAYDTLRREKMRNLQGVKAAPTPYQRHTPVQPGTKLMTPGVPTQKQREQQREAQVRATRIVANEKWAGIKK